jgi:hypothetical protein
MYLRQSRSLDRLKLVPVIAFDSSYRRLIEEAGTKFALNTIENEDGDPR